MLGKKDLRWLKAITFIVAGFIVAGLQAQVVINEVCPSNNSIIKDLDQDYPDWIELFNSGDEDVNLAGYCLSDDSENYTKWCFPDYLLKSGEYLLIFASQKDLTHPPLYWNTVINEGDEWKYIIPDQIIPDVWMNPEYDDSGWLSGPTGIGYADDDDATIIDYSTVAVFMRKRFSIENSSDIVSYLLHMDFDDAFVAYINGTEVARQGILGNPPAYNSLAFIGREATIYGGGMPLSYDLINDTNLLTDGENLLAIQVHNLSETSSDFSAIPFLSLQSSIYPQDNPPELLKLSQSYFHTNFNLNVDGETLYLSNHIGIILDSLEFPSMKSDHSIGRVESLQGNVIFTIPTPGAVNSSTWYEGYVNELPQFSVSGGRFEGSFQLSLSSDINNDSIYYSIDGSDPDSQAILYQEPIEISTDKIIRAKIYRPGFIEGGIATNTYFQGSDNQLPVICISTDPFNLWDYNEGIYTPGPGAQAGFPHFGANFWEDWEKPAHIEHYDSAGNLAFSVDAGIKVYGGWTRGHPQKSLAIFARAVYGTNKIEYKLFDNKDIYEFESFIIRNSGNDWVGWGNETGTMFRDVMMTSLTKNMDLEYLAAKQAIIYINGEYWGIQNIREKVNEHFLASNKNADPDNIDLLEANKFVINGDKDHFSALETFMISNDITNPENYEYIKTQMDMQNFINYQLAEIYFDNTDWPGNNIKYWRPRSPNGIWRWILYDTDFGFGLWDKNDVYNNTINFATSPNSPDHPNPPWSTYLLRRLLQNEDFRNQFINSFADQINTSFLTDSVINLVNSLKSNIEVEMINHIERWGGNYQTWITQTEELKEFGRLRRSVMQNFILTSFNLESKRTLDININNSDAGSVKLNSILLENFPFKGTYYQGVPVKLTAIPRPGYKFTGWSGSVNSSSPEIITELTASKNITAIFEISSDDTNPVVINEICYKSGPENESEDWIELHNYSDQFVDISGWVMKDSDDTHSYLINQGTIMGPYGYYVLCRDLTAFESVYPNVLNSEGSFSFGLSGDGELIRLYNETLVLIDSVEFGADYPWPVIPDGSGYTLVLKGPALDNSLPESWMTSSEPLGTPGKENFKNVTVENITSNNDILFQNAPNPFSMDTRIVFYSAKVQPVKLSVYDMNGRMLEILADEVVESGYNEFNWEPVNNYKGTLILRLETPESVYTKKMIRY